MARGYRSWVWSAPVFTCGWMSSYFGVKLVKLVLELFFFIKCAFRVANFKGAGLPSYMGDRLSSNIVGRHVV